MAMIAFQASICTISWESLRSTCRSVAIAPASPRMPSAVVARGARGDQRIVRDDLEQQRQDGLRLIRPHGELRECHDGGVALLFLRTVGRAFFEKRDGLRVTVCGQPTQRSDRNSLTERRPLQGREQAVVNAVRL